MAAAKQRPAGVKDRAADLIGKAGFPRPTPLQQRVIPLLLAGRSILVEAPSGSGKTISIAVPILLTLKASPRLLALILLEGEEALKKAGRQWKNLAKAIASRLTHATIGTGDGVRKEARVLEGRPNVLIVSPQRLIDHLRQGNVELGGVRYIGVDAPPASPEFHRDVEFVLSKCPADRQTVFMVPSLDDGSLSYIRGSRQQVLLRPQDWEKPEGRSEEAESVRRGARRGAEPAHGNRREEVSRDTGSQPADDEEILAATIKGHLERMKSDADPAERNRLKRIFRRNVPLGLRSSFAAYLLRGLSGGAGAPARAVARLFINAGRNRRIYPDDLYDLFTSQLEIQRSALGEVRVLDNYSFVEIQSRYADRAIAELSGKELKGRKLTVNYARPRDEKKRE